MASQEFLKLLNNFETNPSATLLEWRRQLNHILNNLSNGTGYIATDAVNVSVYDLAGLYAAVNVEAALAEVMTAVITNLTRLSNDETKYDGGYLRINTFIGTTDLTAAHFGVVIGNSASPITFNLPTAIGNTSRTFRINCRGAGTITVDGYSSETIQGSATVDVTTGNVIRIISDGSNWYYI